MNYDLNINITVMNLADYFMQSDQHSVFRHFFQFVFPGLEPMAFVLLTQ